MEVIRKLDSEKLQWAKMFTDLESSTDHHNATLIKHRRELDELLSEDVLDESTSNVDDSLVLKLKLFRDLGITFDSDKTKALIQSRTTGSNELYTLRLDENYSDYFISNYIWDKL